MAELLRRSIPTRVWRIVLVMLMATFCGIALAAPGRLGLAAGVVLIFLTAAPAVFRLHSARLDGPGLYGAMAAVCFGLASLVWLASPTTPGPSLDRDDIRAALILVAAGIAAFWIGARLAAGPARPSAPAGASAFPAAWVYAVGYSVCAAAIIVGVATGNYGYLREASSAPLFSSLAVSFVGAVAPVVLLALAIAWLRSNNPRYGVMLAGLLVIHGTLGLVTGVKGESLLPFVLIFFAFIASGRRLPWRAIAGITAVAVLFVLPANEAYRRAVRDPGERSRLRAVADPSVYRPDRTLRDALGYPTVRFRYIDHVALIMRDTPNIYSYGDARRYFLLPFIVVVPRFAWQGKPVMNTAAQFSHTYWEIPLSIRTSQPVTQAGDLYRNFSWAGVLPGLALWGALIGAWSRWWANWRSPRFDAVYLWSIPVAVVYIESDLPTLIATFAKALPLAVAVSWLLLPGRRGDAGFSVLARLVTTRPAIRTTAGA